ncbi:hypothetical protein [Limosilactobacillus urinaemulieris]|uniref:hypothetical protein n=1 Tax=Limosilactobacillus urinaemulieris TaxID=2742600 RepID=UPI0024B93EAC|nr:hypothetical protein [Limosilactobacillus urinaemulieris]
MENVVEEIKGCVDHINKKESDIDWIGSKDGNYAMKWKKFKGKFRNIFYDNGFGAQKIAQDLVVAFNDNSWLEREEYDGAESWTYKEAPVFNGYHDYTIIDVESAGFIGWENLSELNED